MTWLVPLLVLLPVAFALVLLLPMSAWQDHRRAWLWTLIGTALTFIFSLVMVSSFNFAPAPGSVGLGSAAPGAYQFVGHIAWVQGFGLSFGYGVDAIALWLVLLTTLLSLIVLLAMPETRGERGRELLFWLLILEATLVGVFVATDIIFFYACFEFSLIPLYFIIALFGGRRRHKAARLFFFYTFTGSMLTLAGILYVVYFNAHLPGHAWSFDIVTLYHAAAQMSFTQQAFVLAALLAGFGAKAPIWPLHTWVPTVYTETPASALVLLSGVLAKMGVYGMLRFAVPLCPQAAVTAAPYIAVLAIIGILYAALACWAQRDMKQLVAYSSISHMGFIILGIFALDAGNIAPVGAVIYMVNHGLSTGALFLCVGMLYQRFETHDMGLLSGIGRVMPVWSCFAVFFVFASVGLPGLNGFVGEFMTLLGTFVSHHVLGYGFAIPAALCMILAAIYLLYMLARVVWGPVRVPVKYAGRNGERPGVADLRWREIAALAPLAAGCLWLGLYPLPVLRSLEPAVKNLTAAAQVEIQKNVAMAAAKKHDEVAVVNARMTNARMESRHDSPPFLGRGRGRASWPLATGSATDVQR